MKGGDTMIRMKSFDDFFDLLKTVNNMPYMLYINTTDIHLDTSIEDTRTSSSTINTKCVRLLLISSLDNAYFLDSCSFSETRKMEDIENILSKLNDFNPKYRCFSIPDSKQHITLG